MYIETNDTISVYGDEIRRVMVYLSCPMSDGGRLNHEEQKENIYKAIDVTQTLFEKGFDVACPALSWFWADRHPVNSMGKLLALDLEVISRCDIVFRMPGLSKGADLECQFAKDHGISVVYSLDELLSL